MWDNQLQMTMVEIVIISLVLAIMLLVEMYKMDPRELLHKPTDENPFFIDLFKKVSSEDEDDLKKSSKQKKKKKL